ENGAGKSTLMRILAGFEPPTAGRVLFRGMPLARAQPGIVMIHQELNLLEDLTVEENIFLGQERCRGPFLRRREMCERAREILAELRADIDPRTRVRSLSISQKQMVEIAKALSRKADVLIMDEPTAVLTRHEIDVLFERIRRLITAGVALVYISHRLNEVKEVADRVTVLRDGHRVATEAAADLSESRMAEMMVGRHLQEMYPPKAAGSAGPVVLEVRGVTVPGWAQACSFELRRGEILGFAGLVGAGRTELMEGICGLRRRSAGEILLHGRPIQIRSFADAVAQRIVYLSEDRKGKGLITAMPMAPNLTLLSLGRYARPLLDTRAEMAALERAVERFEIRAPHLKATVQALSGGNQQKLALAKILEIDPEVIVLDEPTRGIDVGTKQAIYRLIAALAAAGKACIVISSELPEIVGLSHRVVVMREGTIAAVLSGEAIDEAEIMRYATGVKGAA
ncbi:MAG TPA: sugar ABC transporter ATP-binding protein, partial [Limnochordia bacterium]